MVFFYIRKYVQKQTPTFGQGFNTIFKIILNLNSLGRWGIFSAAALRIDSLFWFYCLIEQSVMVYFWLACANGETSAHLPASASLIIEANVMLIITDSPCWPLIYTYILNSATAKHSVFILWWYFSSERNKAQHKNEVKKCIRFFCSFSSFKRNMFERTCCWAAFLYFLFKTILLLLLLFLIDWTYLW